MLDYNNSLTVVVIVVRNPNIRGDVSLFSPNTNCLFFWSRSISSNRNSVHPTPTSFIDFIKKKYTPLGLHPPFRFINFPSEIISLTFSVIAFRAWKILVMGSERIVNLFSFSKWVFHSLFPHFPQSSEISSLVRRFHFYVHITANIFKFAVLLILITYVFHKEYFNRT